MELVCWINGVVLSDECITARGQRVSCWIDELPPPNGSDPVHEGGTIHKDEGILFPLGLLECRLAQVLQAGRDVGRSKPWVTPVYLGGRREQGVLGWAAALFPLCNHLHLMEALPPLRFPLWIILSLTCSTPDLSLLLTMLPSLENPS